MQKIISLFVICSALATPAFSEDGRYQVVVIGDKPTYLVIDTNTGKTRYCQAYAHDLKLK